MFILFDFLSLFHQPKFDDPLSVRMGMSNENREREMRLMGVYLYTAAR